MTPGSLEALKPYGWNDRVSALFAGHLDSGDYPARVVRVERIRAMVAGPAGEHFVATTVPLAVGDWVLVGGDGAGQPRPRWSSLARADPDHGVQVLAANVDLVIVTAPADHANPARVERELALAWQSEARPLVAVTKADLAPPGLVEELQARWSGADVITVSVRDGRGVDEVRQRLAPDLTAVLLGPSGAGKSSLANALLDDDRQAVGEVRSGDGRGRHTTTSRQLVCLPGGGVLIDTPGLRSLGLLGATVGVELAFPDLADLAAQCRFGNCSHTVEPGCAVSAAEQSGRLPPERLASFRKLQAEARTDQKRVTPVPDRPQQPRRPKRRSRDADDED